jgi:hypothetical protein
LPAAFDLALDLETSLCPGSLIVALTIDYMRILRHPNAGSAMRERRFSATPEIQEKAIPINSLDLGFEKSNPISTRIGSLITE